MDRTRLEVQSGVWLEAAGALWLARERLLVVADLHLGYAWAHRAEGNLLPLSRPEDTSERLLTLVERYAPEEIVLLGDIVHRAVPIAPVQDELRVLCARLGACATLRLVAGNHDRELAPLLRACELKLEISREWRVGQHLLVHGDRDEESAERHLAAARATGGLIVLGHEHPAVSLSDGVATRAKCPCFLVSGDVIVLPAFTAWAAGSEIRRGRFLSPYARLTVFDRAIASVNGKLLPVSLR